jgi:predicted HAD superfamily Cof-like phosphohydrolase
MMTLLEQARKFREIFNQETLDNISRFGFIKKNLWDMQLRLIAEEGQEFMIAADECFADPENTDRREELVKELSDLVFVCYQFAATYGIDLDKAMQLVYESNLSKLDEQGKPIYREDGKVLKGPSYLPPNLADCLPKPQLNYYDTNGK